MRGRNEKGGQSLSAVKEMPLSTTKNLDALLYFLRGRLIKKGERGL